MLDVPAFRRFTSALLLHSPQPYLHTAGAWLVMAGTEAVHRKSLKARLLRFIITNRARNNSYAQIVNINLAVMPFVALNTVISLLALSIYPIYFLIPTVIDLPEYRIQSSIMEEAEFLVLH